MQSNSPAFSFNKIDWLKTVRFLLVLAAGSFVTYGIPFFTGFSYVFKGIDFTPVVLIALSSLGEALRRYIADHSN